MTEFKKGDKIRMKQDDNVMPELKKGMKGEVVCVSPLSGLGLRGQYLVEVDMMVDGKVDTCGLLDNDIELDPDYLHDQSDGSGI